MRAKTRSRRGFGAIRKLPSKRYQASYLGPDMVRYKGPFTFESREDAEGWLHEQRVRLSTDTWVPPRVRKRGMPTFAEYATPWLDMRELKPATRALYESLLRVHLLPTF